jgi:hypothetical protein
MITFRELGQFGFKADRDAQRQPNSLFAHKVRGITIELFLLDYGVIVMHYDAIEASQ